MEAVRTSEISAYFNDTTRRYVQTGFHIFIIFLPTFKPSK
jgi:hypothetical protein